MEHDTTTIKITQEMIKTGDADYTVKMTVNDGEIVEAIEFNYEKTNAIYPLYKSLREVITRYENVHIKLQANHYAYTQEIKGVPNRSNTRLLEMLRETQKQRNITIDAYLLD